MSAVTVCCCCCWQVQIMHGLLCRLPATAAAVITLNFYIFIIRLLIPHAITFTCAIRTHTGHDDDDDSDARTRRRRRSRSVEKRERENLVLIIYSVVIMSRGKRNKTNLSEDDPLLFDFVTPTDSSSSSSSSSGMKMWKRWIDERRRRPCISSAWCRHYDDIKLDLTNRESAPALLRTYVFVFLSQLIFIVMPCKKRKRE